MANILSSTQHALRSVPVIRELQALTTRRSRAMTMSPDGEPCIGAKVAALQIAIQDLMSEHPDDLSPEARTILRALAPLSFRCRDLWRAM